ncbi:hypothetical protein F4859DRAFT_136722 [Xylaria cf. heliscus]|nr:hypothetical protein F4859DRAFT_136722 [Xylaria cf. heliscus]
MLGSRSPSPIPADWRLSFESFRGSSIASARSGYDNDDQGVTVLDTKDALQPDQGSEQDYHVPGNKFAFSPGMLNKLMNPKSLAAFWALGGLAGLERGLRTNVKDGLEINEQSLTGTVMFEDAVTASTYAAEKDDENEERSSSLRTATNANPNVVSLPPFEQCFLDRKYAFGTHTLPRRRQRSLLKTAAIISNDPTLITLTVLTVVALGLGLHDRHEPSIHSNSESYAWPEYVAILVMVSVISLCETFLEDYKQRTLETIDQETGHYGSVQVIRSGKRWEIPRTQVVVGDLVLLRLGDSVTMDGIVIKETGLLLDESSATGEDGYVAKTSAGRVGAAIRAGQNLRGLDPFIVGGSRVTAGHGLFLVTAVGTHSSWGKTMVSMAINGLTPGSETQLRQFFGGPLAIAGLLVALSLFIGLFVKFLVLHVRGQASGFQKGLLFLDLSLLTNVVILLALPVPFVMTADLFTALMAARLTKDECFVNGSNDFRKTRLGIETLSTTTTLFVDIECLLDHEAVPEVQIISIGTALFAADELVSRPDDRGAIDENNLLDLYGKRQLFAQALVSTYSGRQVQSAPAAAALNFAYNQLDGQSLCEQAGNTLITQSSLNNGEDQNCTIGIMKLSNGKFRIFLRGSHAAISAKCSHTLAICEDTVMTTVLTPDTREGLENSVDRLSVGSMCVSALAYVELDDWSQETYEIENTTNLVYIGVIGTASPPHNGTIQAVRTFQAAGVFVRMATSESFELATAVARRCGILVPGGIALKSTELGIGIESTIPRLCVLAECDLLGPTINTLLKTQQKMYEVITWVSGEVQIPIPIYNVYAGRNEYHGWESNIDLVVLKSGLLKVSKLLMWSRCIRAVMRRLVYSGMVLTITAVTVTFVSALPSLNAVSILRPVHLLWLYLLLVVLGGLIIIIDLPEPESLLRRKPYRKSAPLIDLHLWKMITGQIVYQLAALFIFTFGSRRFLGYSNSLQAGTLVFSILAWMQIFNMLGSRYIDDNVNGFRHLWAGYSFIVLSLALIIAQTPVLFFGCTPFGLSELGRREWAISILVGVGTIPTTLALKQVPDRLAWIVVPRAAMRVLLSRRQHHESVARENEPNDPWDRRPLVMDSDVYPMKPAWHWWFRRGRLALLASPTSY